MTCWEFLRISYHTMMNKDMNMDNCMGYPQMAENDKYSFMEA